MSQNVTGRYEAVTGVDLWIALTDDWGDRDVELCRRALSPSESDACGRLRRPEDRRDYAAAHALLRGVLSRYLDIPPARLPLVVDPRGKIHLAEPYRGLEFNLSHTTGLVAVSVRSGHVVGVDVERTSRSIDVAKIARMLAPEEESQLLQMDERPQRDGFLTLWTVKEAYLKARGVGLSLPLREFVVRLSPDGLTAEALVPEADDPVRNWSVHVGRPDIQSVWAVVTPEGRPDGAALRVLERIVSFDELGRLLGE